MCRQQADHSGDAELIESSRNSVRVFYVLKVFFQKRDLRFFVLLDTFSRTLQQRYFAVSGVARNVNWGPPLPCPLLSSPSISPPPFNGDPGV